MRSLPVRVRELRELLDDEDEPETVKIIQRRIAAFQKLVDPQLSQCVMHIAGWKRQLDGLMNVEQYQRVKYRFGPETSAALETITAITSTLQDALENYHITLAELAATVDREDMIP